MTKCSEMNRSIFELHKNVPFKYAICLALITISSNLYDKLDMGSVSLFSALNGA